MLEVDQVKFIIRLTERKDLSYAETAKLLDIDPRTVKKYVEMEDHSPQVQRRNRNSPVMEPVKPIIDQILQVDRKAPKKQRHTAKRIYDRLCLEHGFEGSYRSVRRYVSQKKKEIFQDCNKEYLPLTPLPGDAEFDFGDVQVVYQGQQRLMQEAVLTFPHSNVGFSQLFHSNNQECVIEFLKRVFEFVGGVPKRIRFDNLTSVVHKDSTGKKVLNDNFQRFANHYRFESVFCNEGKGHEKGNVENKVGYIRRNWYTPVPEFQNEIDLVSFNQQLFQKAMHDMNRIHYAKKKPITNLWKEDLDHLLFLNEIEYDNHRLKQYKTDKRGLISVEGCRYSTKPSFVNKKIWVKIYHDHIEILDQDYTVICTHPRQYLDQSTPKIDWSIYLSALRKKPRALINTEFYQSLSQDWRHYIDQSPERALRNIEAFLKQSRSAYAPDISRLSEEFHSSILDSLDQQPVKELPDYLPDLSVYDSLLRREGESA